MMKLAYSLPGGIEIVVPVQIDQICIAHPPDRVVADGMDEECRRLFKATVYFVEAGRHVADMLTEHHRERGFEKEREALYTIEIGQICGHAVSFSLCFWKVKGKIICFYDMEGQYAIWSIGRGFLEGAAPKVSRTDTLNIWHALSHLT